MGLFAQERVKPKGPPSFAELHKAIATHFQADHFGQAYAGSKQLMQLIGVRHAESIRLAIPTGKGYEKVPPKKKGRAEQTMLAGLSMAVGNVITQDFRGGPGRLQTTVSADSPVASMFSMISTNPGMLKEGQELIKYRQGMALLETHPKRITFQMVLGGSLVNSQFHGHDADYVLGVWSQDAVDGLELAITH